MRLSGPTLLPTGSSPFGHITPATLHITDGHITQVLPGLDPNADLITTGTIMPGFIDLQVNGAYGFDFTTDGRTVAAVAQRLPATGITGFLPTIITAPFDSYPGRLAEIRDVTPSAGGARVLGVHLEGPYFNPLKKGAHNPALLRPIHLGEIVEWAEPDIVRVVTLAPELPGALDAILALRRNGVIVSAGHSNATYAEAAAGFEAGITWGTHLFNAMSALGQREPGLPGALLTSAVPCGLIIDGVHVHPAMVALAYRAKGAAGITIVTDCMEAMGMPPGQYVIGDRPVTVDETSARLADGTLAGSVVTMDQSLRNMIAFTGCSLPEAAYMASTAPARLLGLERLGQIAPGGQADLVVLDEDLQVAQTIVGGQLVYQAP